MTIEIQDDIDGGDSYAFQYNAADETVIVDHDVTLKSTQTVVDMNETGGILINDGTINGRMGVDVGPDNMVTNKRDGAIDGTLWAVIVSGASSIANAGLLKGDTYGIWAFGSGLTVRNSGIIVGSGSAGIATDAMNTAIVNTGTIIGGDAGLSLGARSSMGSSRVTNSGTIWGVNDAIAAGAFGGALTIVNSGTLDGAVTLSMETDKIVNTGRIKGDIVFDLGNDIYDGRNGGTVTGTIDGGEGADKLIAGAAGDRMAGGAGHDTLYGGAGADTFAFSSYRGADSDVVKGFDVSNDTIQFDHTVFTHLVAGHTPSFAIGTTASSATDFLFYNSGTGNLYYDVDGNKSAHAPFLIANLGTGLQMTASDFNVV